MYSKRPEFQLWAMEVGEGILWLRAGAALLPACCYPLPRSSACLPPLHALPACPPCLPACPPPPAQPRPPARLQVKKIDIEAMPRSEEKEMFKEFMEEFNTATLPHRWGGGRAGGWAGTCLRACGGPVVC